MTNDIKAQAAKLAEDFKKRGKKVNTEIGKAILKGCLTIERYAKTHMSPNGPSEPGVPPAVDTGRLRASITHRVENESGFKPVGFIGTNVNYGPMLEFGTSRMKPRPWLVPALDACRPEFEKDIKAALQTIEEVPNG